MTSGGARVWSNTRVLKLGLIAYFLFATYVFLRLRDSAPTGYEISLFRYTPWETWLLLSITEVAGIGIIVWQALSKREGNAWAYGFIFLVLGNVLITSLWVLRGYFNWFGNDVNAHFALIGDYLGGLTSTPNIYPTTHISQVQAVFLTGLPTITVFKLFPAFLTGVGMINVMVLARFLLKDNRGAALLSIAVTAPMLYGIYHIEVYPRGLAQILLPAVVWLYFLSRNRSAPWITASMLLCIAGFVFVHPILMLMLVMFLAMADLALAAYDWYYIRKGEGATKRVSASPWRNVSLATFFVGCVVSYTWFSSVAGGHDFTTIVKQIGMAVAGRQPSDWLWKASKVLEGVSGWERIEFFAKLYAPNLILWSFVGLGILLLLWQLWKGRSTPRYLAALVPWVLASNLIWIPFFAFVGGSAVVETNAASAVTAAFVGWTIYCLVGGFTRALLLRVAVVVAFISIVAMSGFLALYRSPYLFQANPQLVRTDVATIQWVLNNKLPYVLYTGIGIPYSTAFFVLGRTAMDYERPDLAVPTNWTGILWYNVEILPPHFGYYEHDTYGEQWAQDKYVILTERFDMARNDPTLSNRGRVVGPAVGRWDFNDRDLMLWEEDPTVSRIYDNGGSRVYLTHGGIWR